MAESPPFASFPGLQDDEDEYELDIDALDPETCWKLQAFVDSVLAEQAAKQPGAAAAPAAGAAAAAAGPLAPASAGGTPAPGGGAVPAAGGAAPAADGAPACAGSSGESWACPAGSPALC
jgi:hypothetical protein